MNCREFRRKHAAFVDDTLSGVDLQGMANHRRLCERCAQLDTRVRRALLVARNLPTIHPSPAFGDRLQARLHAERASHRVGTDTGDELFIGRHRPFTSSTYTVVAAGLMVAAGLAGLAAFDRSGDDAILLAPVVASHPEGEPSAMSAPAMVAAMPAGMPVWPAVFVAQQAPWHLASDAASPR